MSRPDPTPIPEPQGPPVHKVQPPEAVGRVAAAKGLGGCLAAFNPRKRWTRETKWDIYVFEEGCVLDGQRGQGIEWFDWSDVSDFRQSVHTTKNGGFEDTDFAYKFTLTDGRVFSVKARATTLTESGLEDFGPLVDRQVTAARLPAVLAKLEQGTPVDFGSFTLTVAGVAYARKIASDRFVAWADLEQVSVANGQVWVKERGRRMRWSESCSAIPNLTMFLVLIEALRQAVGGH